MSKEASATSSSMREWGLRFIELKSGQRCLALATHTHFDHIGGHHEFSGCTSANVDILSDAVTHSSCEISNCIPIGSMEGL